MKITHIITGLNDGGAEAVLYRLCTYDQSLKHYVISLMDSGKYGPLLQRAGIDVVCLDLPEGKLRPIALWRLWRALRRQRPDVVQTWMYHANLVGGIAARLAGTRRVIWGIHHTTLDPVHSKRSTMFVSRACAWVSQSIPARIVCCADAALVVHRSHGYAAEKLLVIPNGYDIGKFSPDPVERKRLRAEWKTGDTFLIGMVGRFDPQKDHRNLLDALRLLDSQGINFSAVLIGPGVDEKNTKLSTWLAELGLNGRVQLLGQRTDIPAVMNALDVHILPSAYGEAFPNVVAEAMACGTPAIVTDVGDAAAMVLDTGWVVPAKNAEALSAAVKEAIDAMKDETQWSTRQQAARDRIVENFSLDRVSKQYRVVWEGEEGFGK